MSETKQIVSNTLSSAQGVTGNLLNRTKGDKVIWAIVILLTMVSILVVYSSIGSLAYRMNKSTESYLFRQVGYICLGVHYYLFCTPGKLYNLFAPVFHILCYISSAIALYIKIWKSY